jgi:predicted amidohydrolase YtcJ
LRFDVNPHRAALALLLAPLLLLATGTGWPAPRAAPADTILVNGRVLTLDPQDTVADAVAIRDGKILAVGSNDAVRSRARRDTRVIDLHGRTATPGLIDTHAHIADGGVQTLYSVELGDATDIAEVKRRVAARVSALKAGQWLLGHGWDEGKFSEGRYIFASDLDDIAPANPVWLEHTTGHYGAANTAALNWQASAHQHPTPPPARSTVTGAANRPACSRKPLRTLCGAWSPSGVSNKSVRASSPVSISCTAKA